MNQRMCVACKKRADKSNFVRIEKVNDVVVLSNKKTDGTRGVYLCFDKNCVDKAKKSNVVGRTFKSEIKDEFYETIKNYIERNLDVK